jgi:hypothetical protein
VRAKAVYVQELANGSTPVQAMEKAVKVVDEMYENKIKQLINHQNTTVTFFARSIPHYKQVCDAEGHSYNVTVNPTPTGYRWWVLENSTECASYGSDCNYEYKVLKEYYRYCSMTKCFEGYTKLNIIKIDNVELYNYTLFKDCLDKLVNDKKWVADNLVNYFTQVNQLVESGQLNISQVANMVLDPYAIITMAKNDSANYYAWSAYDLALLGLGTNLTAPVKIVVDNQTYEGYLFASDGFNSTLTVNGTYVVPQGESVYLLTPNGKILVLKGGESFKLVSATDEKTGKPLQNITLVRYVDHSLEAQRILEDVEKLIELYNITLQKTTTTGGGGSSWADSINNFWNGLDWQVKALIIGGGILVGLVLIGRAFGRGGVSVIKLGK